MASEIIYIKKILLTWSSETLTLMTGKGVLIHNGWQTAGRILFVPQGWIVVEQVVRAHNLIYGVRKSMMRKSPAAVSNY